MYARESQLAGRGRLRGLQEHTEAIGDAMTDERRRFERLAGDDAKPRAVSSFNLFPTPPALADRVAQLARITTGHKILEPSAGTGNLLAAIGRLRIDAQAVAVEINPTLCEHLQSYFVVNVTVYCRDFLATGDELGKFGRIVMNPPFKMGTDIKHILHARSMLAPGGRLVSICAAGPKQRAKLQPIADEWIDLPAGSFKGEGTDVQAAIVIFEN